MPTHKTWHLPVSPPCQPQLSVGPTSDLTCGGNVPPAQGLCLPASRWRVSRSVVRSRQPPSFRQDMARPPLAYRWRMLKHCRSFFVSPVSLSQPCNQTFRQTAILTPTSASLRPALLHFIPRPATLCVCVCSSLPDSPAAPFQEHATHPAVQLGRACCRCRAATSPSSPLAYLCPPPRTSRGPTEGPSL